MKSFSEFIPSSVMLNSEVNNKIGNVTMYQAKIRRLCGIFSFIYVKVS